MCVAVLKSPYRFGIQQTSLASYTLKMANFDMDQATRQACSVISGNDCKDLQRVCLGHFLSNWKILGPIGGTAVDEVHREIHW